MRVFRLVRWGASTFGELIVVLRHQKRWWLVPLVVILLLFGILFLLGQATPLGPWIYSLF
jgi:hypothetical protein